MKTTVLAVSVAAFALLPFDQALAQAAFPPPPPKVSPAAGVIDMHVQLGNPRWVRPGTWTTSTWPESAKVRRHARPRAQEPHQRSR